MVSEVSKRDGSGSYQVVLILVLVEDGLGVRMVKV